MEKILNVTQILTLGTGERDIEFAKPSGNWHHGDGLVQSCDFDESCFSPP